MVDAPPLVTWEFPGLTLVADQFVSEGFLITFFADHNCDRISGNGSKAVYFFMYLMIFLVRRTVFLE